MSKILEELKILCPQIEIDTSELEPIKYDLGIGATLHVCDEQYSKPPIELVNISKQYYESERTRQRSKSNC
jgi:hypothetical protein